MWWVGYGGYEDDSGGFVNLTNVKQEILGQEYENLQRYLHGEGDVDLYSANKQQAGRYYTTIKEDKEYPLSIRKDLIDVQECDSDVCDYFVKIPVAGRYGGVHVPVNTHEEIKAEYEICESKLYREEGTFYLNITVKKEVEPVATYDGVLGIDLGLRSPIVGVTLSVAGSSPKILFQGASITWIQAHYSYLRRHASTGKRWRKREHEKVQDALHKITTRLVEYAKKHKLLIVVGDLTGIQQQDTRRVMNRKLHRFPHYTFWQMVAYKAKWHSVEAIRVNEAGTSQRCYKCGKKGVRYKGLFTCGGMEINADVNGAWNIAKRAFGKSERRSMLGVGAAVTQPELLSDESTSATASRGAA